MPLSSCTALASSFNRSSFGIADADPSFAFAAAAAAAETEAPEVEPSVSDLDPAPAPEAREEAHCEPVAALVEALSFLPPAVEEELEPGALC